MYGVYPNRGKKLLDCGYRGCVLGGGGEEEEEEGEEEECV